MKQGRMRTIAAFNFGSQTVIARAIDGMLGIGTATKRIVLERIQYLVDLFLCKRLAGGLICFPGLAVLKFCTNSIVSFQIHVMRYLTNW